MTTIAQLYPNIQFQSSTIENGLSGNNLNQIIKDNKGFYWMAAVNGLCRYDGVSYRIFKNEAENINSISSDYIRAIYQDSKGYLWIGTLKDGISRYDFKTGKFTHFKHNKKETGSISSNEILCFFEDSKGFLWVGTENGLNRFNYEKGTFLSFLPSNRPNSISASAVIAIAEDSRGWLWAGTWSGGLNLIIPTNDVKKYEFRHFKKETGNAGALKSDHVWSLFNDNAGRFWVGMFNGGLSLMLPNNETDPLKLEPQFATYRHTSIELDENQPVDNIIFTINQDSKGLMWFGTSNGMSVFYPDYHFSNMESINPDIPSTIPTINFKHIQKNANNDYSVIHNEVRDIYIDDNNRVWCSTIGGASVYDPSSVRFDHFLSPTEARTNIFISSILENEVNDVFVGTRAKYGLMRYNPETNNYISYLHNSNNKNSIADNEIISLKSFSQDTIWVGTRNGFSIFNPKTEKFTNMILRDDDGNIIKGINAKDFYRDSRGNFWITTEIGLVKYNIATQETTAIYDASKNSLLRFENANTNNVLEDKEGNLWVTTYGGLYKITFKDGKESSIKSYLHDVNKSRSICSNRTLVLALVNERIWIGTEDGLAKYNPETDDFDNITGKDGLPDPSIVSIQSDNQGRIWLGSRQGLLLIEPETNIIRAFDRKDGLQGNTFNHFASDKGKSGKIYFGGINGYNAFLGEEIPLNDTPPPIFITGVKIFNKYKAFDKDYSDLEEIKLSYKENYFTIEFSALNYTQSDENQYAYKLEGFDKNWMYTGQRNFASYTNLDGGTYTFRVKAANNDGFWNEEGIAIKVRICPPFWKTTWFRILILLTLLATAWGIYKGRIRAIRQREEQLKSEVHKRTKEIETQKREIENLAAELKRQNESLEEKVKQRTNNLERVNNDLLRSNKDLEQFAYIASHDLQEPLRMVGNFVQLLELRYGNKLDKNGKEYIGFAVEGVRRMSDLIKSLLNYSRVGRSDSFFSVADLNKILGFKIQNLSLLIKERNAQVICNPLPKSIFCEQDQIGIVFYNLIHNAIKFNSTSAPTVEISLDMEGDSYWTFSVKDNGIGIERDYTERIFEIFKRLNNREEFDGNGIGLSLCKRIVSRHDGNIWFESELGKGTVFYFTISKDLKNVKEEA
jgi:ligand-binding sensor domain-containing protein/signal transduction histidine kinase